MRSRMRDFVFASATHRILARSGLLLLALMSRESLAGNIITVGPGGDAATIAGAVSFAQDGDTLLVQSTPSQAVLIDGKGLRIVAAGSTKPKLAAIVVRNLPASSSVVVRGFTIEAPVPNQPPSVTIRVEDCDGPVRFEDCVAKPGINAQQDTAAAAIVDACLDVAFSRCDLTGGFGFGGHNDFPNPSAPDPGAAALRISGSRVAVLGSTLTGGAGGAPDIIDGEYAFDGKDGGPAIRLLDGELFCADSILNGGTRGSPSCNVDILFGIFDCGDPGHSGDCIANPGGAAVVLDNTYHPGGTDGRISENAIAMLPGHARRLVSDAVAHSGSSATLVFDGEPGDQAVAFASLAPSQQKVPGLIGEILVAFPIVIGPIGLPIPDLTGSPVSISLPVPSLPPAVDGMWLHFQAAALDAGTGRIVLGSASSELWMHP